MGVDCTVEAEHGRIDQQGQAEPGNLGDLSDGGFVVEPEDDIAIIVSEHDLHIVPGIIGVASLERDAQTWVVQRGPFAGFRVGTVSSGCDRAPRSAFVTAHSYVTAHPYRIRKGPEVWPWMAR